jgi:hypothetical protein
MRRVGSTENLLQLSGPLLNALLRCILNSNGNCSNCQGHCSMHRNRLATCRQLPARAGSTAYNTALHTEFKCSAQRRMYERLPLSPELTCSCKSSTELNCSTASASRPALRLPAIAGACDAPAAHDSMTQRASASVKHRWSRQPEEEVKHKSSQKRK